MQGRNKKGRLRQIWTQGIEEEVVTRVNKWEDIKEVMQDREGWE